MEERIAPLIHNPGNRWRLLGSLTLRPLYPIPPGTPIIQTIEGWVDLRASLNCGNDKYLCHRREWHPDIPVFQLLT
jgi:hypothetical protein